MAYIPYSPQLSCKYTLTAPSGLKAVFNDSADADYVGALTDLSGLDSAEVRESASELTEADGGAHGAFYFGRRPITMSIRVFGAATELARDARIDKLRRVMKECMRLDGILSWQNSPTGSTVQMQTWVRAQQPTRITGNWVKEIQIALVSQYAPLYGSTLKQSADTASGTGIVVENQGDYPTYPLFQLVGTSTNPAVTNPGAQGLRTTGLSLANTERVEFDMLNHTGVFLVGARAGQSANRYIDFANTQFIPLVSGNNTITLSFGGTLKIIYRDAWG